MAEFDLFLSYASADLVEAEALERWLQLPPRNRTIWRDRRDILPGAPDYYPPILEGISASNAFLFLLSPKWLCSEVAARELSDAQASGKKLVPVVHPRIPRDPTTPEGRERKDELMRRLQTSNLVATLERPNWIWPVKDELSQPDYTQVEQALVTDFVWADHHTAIVQRLNRWKRVQNEAALLRGAELTELMHAAIADEPNRKPVLTDEQRTFLLESQRHESAERERVEGLYWGTQARAAAFAARERGEAEPDLALLLAAESASIATVPEARAILLSLLHENAALTGAINGHCSARCISGVAFSPDGRWLASIDNKRAVNDDRPAHLLVHDTKTGREWKRITIDQSLSAVAWGQRWLAVGSPGSIGWLCWDDWKRKFRGNTPTGLDDTVMPDYLAFSPPGAAFPQGDVLAWGTKWGDIGLIRVGDHVRWQGRLSNDQSSNALSGLGWLMDGRLITAEGGRLLVRPLPDLEPAQEISAPGQVFSLACDGERWVAACRREGSVGLLLGKGAEEETFLPMTSPDLARIAAWAGPPDDPWIVIGSSTSQSGVPAVTLWKGEVGRDTLLKGDEEVVSSVAADPSGRFVAAGENGGRLWLWDRHRLSHLVGMARAGVPAQCIASSSTGRSALATEDNRILIFGPNFDGDPVADVPTPFLPARLLFADGGRMLLAVSKDNQLAILGEDGVMQILPWPPDLGEPTGVAAAANAKTIAVLSSDNTINVLRLTQASMSPICMIAVICTIAVGTSVFEFALAPSAQRVYAMVGPLLRVVSWKVDEPHHAPAEVATIHNSLPGPITCSGEELIVIGDGLDLRFVPHDSPETATRGGGHDEPVKRIATGAGVIASVACWLQDTDVDQIRLWAMDGQPLGPVTLPEHAKDILVCPDGSSLLALGHSGKLWRLPLGAEVWIETARRIAGRDLTAEEQRRYGIDVWRKRALPPRDE